MPGRAAVIADTHANLPALHAALAPDLDDCGCAYVTPHGREIGQRSVEWTLAHTDQAAKGFMRELPFDLRFEVGATRRDGPLISLGQAIDDVLDALEHVACCWHARPVHELADLLLALRDGVRETARAVTSLEHPINSRNGWLAAATATSAQRPSSARASACASGCRP